MEHQHPTHHHLFIASVVQSLHFSVVEFMANVAAHYEYERMLYRWITKCYQRGKSSEETLQLIYKARNFFLLRREQGCGEGWSRKF